MCRTTRIIQYKSPRKKLWEASKGERLGHETRPIALAIPASPPLFFQEIPSPVRHTDCGESPLSTTNPFLPGNADRYSAPGSTIGVSTPYSSTSLRPLVLIHGPLEHLLLVRTTLGNSERGLQVQLAIFKVSLLRPRLRPYWLGINSIISRPTLSPSFSRSEAVHSTPTPALH